MGVISYEVPINVQRMTIGVQGENNVREFLFDVTEWRNLTGDIGAAEMVVQRNGDASPYAAVITMHDENTVSWVPTSTDTEKVGAGKLQLMWIAGGQTVKTKIFDMKVDPSLDYAVPDTSLDPWASWMPNLLNADARVKNLEEKSSATQSDLMQEIASRTSGDNLLQAQIDQIVAPSGEAPSAAEVQNARVGLDGVTYDTLGEAIRGQVGDLKSDIQAVGGLNNKDLWTQFAPKSKTIGGQVQFEWTDLNTCAVSGTATGGAKIYQVFSNPTSFPTGMEPGSVVSFVISRTDPNILARIVWAKDGSLTDTGSRYLGDGETMMLIPSDVSGLAIRVQVNNTMSANGVIHISMPVIRQGEEVQLSASGKYPLNSMASFYDVIGNGTINGSAGSVDYTLLGALIYNVTRLISYQPFTPGQDCVMRCNLGYRFRLYEVIDNKVEIGSTDWFAEVDLQGGKTYLFYGANSSGTTITPEEKYQFFIDTCGQEIDILHSKAEAMDVITPGINWFSPYYTQGYYGTFTLGEDGSATKIVQQEGESVRASIICITLSEPKVLTLLDTDYVFRLYYRVDGTTYSTAWRNTWEIPAGKTIHLTIKRKDEGRVSGKPWLSFFPLDISSEPKDYFKAELANTISKVKQYNTEPGLCFLLSTDQHYNTVQGNPPLYDSVTDMAINMRAVCREINVDANVSLGDIADFKWYPDRNMINERYGLDESSADLVDGYFRHWMDYALLQLRLVGPELIYVVGNHDDNRYINLDTLQEAVSAYDFSPGEMYAYYASISRHERVSNLDNNGLDYYLDYPQHKIRLFCIDTNYYTQATNKWFYGISDSTVEWLRGQLAQIPDGWSVLIFGHQSTVQDHNGDNAAYKNFAAVKGIIQSFVNQGGRLIAYLYGHQHADWADTDPWLEICFNSQKSTVQTISSFPPVMQDAISPARTAGTETEDSWNVVLIKPISKRIDVIRFGAGADRFFHYDDRVISDNITLNSLFGSVSHWVAKNPAIATVSDGVVAPVAPGRTAVYAVDADGNREYWSIVVQ